jgi:protein-tyrosine phosphatase
MVDIHCHVLPGVDDGSESMVESLEMLRKAAAGGVETIIATPHLIRGTYETEFSEREQMTADLQRAADENGINIQVRSGVEYYLSPQILEDSNRLNEFTLNNNGKYILIELPMQIFPTGLEDVFFNLNVKGITPVLAHPERNTRICRNPDILFEFVKNGLITQVNAGSIMGYYGRERKKTAQILLVNKLAHVVASDMHSATSTTMNQAIPLVEKLVGKERTKRLFIENPSRILNGETIYEEPQQIKSERKGLRGYFSRRKKQRQEHHGK